MKHSLDVAAETLCEAVAHHTLKLRGWIHQGGQYCPGFLPRQPPAQAYAPGTQSVAVHHLPQRFRRFQKCCYDLVDKSAFMEPDEIRAEIKRRRKRAIDLKLRETLWTL